MKILPTHPIELLLSAILFLPVALVYHVYWRPQERRALIAAARPE